ncbi:DEAD/DEAH box helicase [Sutcliffiella horikoshii]|uniref:DEAD/DEAH box helicase n=1 Tax=Sutcliffiella horikoshii TaxID=79883 RepID=A0AA94WMQ9_9BACI|nr:DEAD/DEAH box helicase [Sutcliffiella horikoshii]TYS55452.1 DEAD/DEAH box helicase [Sutcliffiella horikoshii]
MNIKVDKKLIQERCGSVSLKSGEAFRRADKVKIEEWTNDRCIAVVSTSEDFHVVVTAVGTGDFHTSCTCPKLASVKLECQHIAAVLLTIYENHLSQHDLSEEVFRLFQADKKPTSGSQLHFEKRKVVDVAFALKPVVKDKENFLGIELSLNQSIVQDPRKLLQAIKNGKRSDLFDPEGHCFNKEADAVIQYLIDMLDDEKTFLEEIELLPQELILPPSSFRKVATLLQQVDVKMHVNKQAYNGFTLVKEPLSLHFSFTEEHANGVVLKIDGLNDLFVFRAYNTVFKDGSFISLDTDDCRRLAELKRMLNASKTNSIPIALNQVQTFVEKVVPGLRKLGKVELDETVAKRFAKTPLVAKLYLDRVKNRLLASIEFQYEQVMINPLDSKEHRMNTMIIRDYDKEQMILDFMEDSKFGSTEEGYFLHNEELEYQFLYHVLPKLQRFVQVYATTAIRNRIFREPTKPQIRIRVKKERTNWLEFKFEMDGIPESQIRELLSALEEKRKYYRLNNGSLLSLETREFEEIQRFLQANPVQDEDLEHGLNVPIIKGFKMMDSVKDDAVFSLEESFRQFLEEIRNPASENIPVPNQVDKILRDYQIHGYRWMKTLAHYGFGGILADDMGLGKTLQSITFILSELPDIRHKKCPILIVTPSSLTYNWLGELRKFAPEINAFIMDGTRKDREQAFSQIKEVDVVITSYPLLRRDVNLYATNHFHAVFFDEAQAFKNPVTQTFRAVKRVKSDYKFALTGTPVENSLEELWSIFHVVFPELFMGLKEYSNLTRKTIARRIRPFMLRRVKEDVLAELPEKIESLESVELLPEQKKLYAAYLAKLRHDTLKHLNKDTLRKNKIRILAGLTRLRQICCHPSLFVHGYKGSSAKFEMLLQMIEESQRSGRRVLIFSQFTKMLELIGRELAYQGLPYFYLDGQTPSEERVERCERFNSGERDFFLISLKAGGTGLNLTGADTVILYDLWWNPAVEEQAADRAHRMGQTQTVQVIKLVARGTIEEKMNELQDKKRHLIEEIIDPDKRVSNSLTDDDIREILSI